MIGNLSVVSREVVRVTMMVELSFLPDVESSASKTVRVYLARY
jgi:hypothetical protein